MKGTIQVVAVGDASRALVRELSEAVHAQFGLEAVVGAPLGDPKYAFNKDRQQYHSTAILRRLAGQRAKDQFAVVGIAELDLFIPDARYVFGEADRQSMAAIVSLARLRPEYYGAPPDIDLLRARGRAEFVHEVGHLLGLSHCDDLRCVMYFSASVADTDRKGDLLCHDCRAELERIVGMKRLETGR